MLGMPRNLKTWRPEVEDAMETEDLGESVQEFLLERNCHGLWVPSSSLLVFSSGIEVVYAVLSGLGYTTPRIKCESYRVSVVKALNQVILTLKYLQSKKTEPLSQCCTFLLRVGNYWVSRRSFEHIGRWWNHFYPYRLSYISFSSEGGRSLLMYFCLLLCFRIHPLV